MDIWLFLAEGDLSLPHDDSAKKIMNDEGFKAYVHEHGFHFTDALADKASQMMDGITWTSREVEQAIEPILGRNRNKFSNGDITYIANMARTDFYPKLLKAEADCLEYAAIMAEDSDGYEGLPMMRWISDLVGKHITDIHWSNYL